MRFAGLEAEADAERSVLLTRRKDVVAAMRKLFEHHRDTAQAWAHRLADEVQNVRLRAEILSYKTVAECFQKRHVEICGAGHRDES